MKPVTKLVIALMPVLLLIGCGDKAVKPDEPATAPVTVEDSDAGVTTAEPAEGERLQDVTQQPGEVAPVTEEADLLSERKIYFDFDESDIKDEFREILQAHADFLAANPNASVVIEGHCDERGTREYNMALGERRAHAVFQFLTLQGVSKNQVRTVSFGEERPDVEGHDESAWKWNRRAVFIYAE